MRLILIRHAESRHIMEKIIAVRSACPGLTENGFAQAWALAQRLRTTCELGEAPRLLCSPALRARQTAEAIASALGLEATEDDRLIEMDTGEAEGMTGAEYEARYGRFSPVSEPSRPFAPGGENWEQFMARVVATQQSIALAHPGQTVVAVTHAGFIVVSFLMLLGISPTEQRAWIDPLHTAFTEWEWIEAKEQWRLVRYNA
jgi:broad specificity phosphatase PhoE